MRWRPPLVLAACALLVAANVRAQPQPGARPPAPPAVRPQPQPGAEAPKRLGRQYPAPVPPSQQQQRRHPGFHVSIISPQASGVHQKIGPERSPRGRGGPRGGGARAGVGGFGSESPVTQPPFGLVR